eukprot:UN34347
MLFTAMLHFRKSWVSLCCNSGVAASWVFGFLQCLVTLARAAGTRAVVESVAYGVYQIPEHEMVGYFLFGFGHLLNAMVYYRLGVTGVYYGLALGLTYLWCYNWPYGPYGITDPQ